MPAFAHDGLSFHFEERGAGTPFVFLHGLGADVSQPLELCLPPPDIRLIALACRGHGQTVPLGDEEKIGLSPYADDVIALLDQLGLEAAAVGGISMGAGVALNLTLRRPDRVTALILSRPAWLDRRLPPNLRHFPMVAELIRTLGPENGLKRFVASHDYRELARTYPANAESLAGQFREPRASEAVARLERIPRDVPNDDRDEWSTIAVPTLVLANPGDLVHPVAYGEALAAAIPDATLRKLTPKTVDAAAHIDDTRTAIGDFLAERVLRKE